MELRVNYVPPFPAPLPNRNLPTMLRFTRPAVALTFCLAGVALIGMKVGDPPAVQMQTFATSLLSTLDEDQKSKAVMEYGSPDRVGWHFIPKKERKGLMLKEMTTAQRTAALRLVRSALSEAGYDKANKIMLLEDVLRELEGESRNWDRDPGMYYLTLFGDPAGDDDASDDAAWGLSFEGHHLSLNFVCRGDEVVDSTPQFFAANPATIMTDVSGPLGKGTRVLRVEEDMAFELINAMDADDRATAIIAEEAPAEIRFAGEAQCTIGPCEGVGFTALTTDQQSMLKDLVGVYVDAVAPKVAEQRTRADRGQRLGRSSLRLGGRTPARRRALLPHSGQRFLDRVHQRPARRAGQSSQPYPRGLARSDRRLRLAQWVECRRLRFLSILPVSTMSLLKHLRQRWNDWCGDRDMEMTIRRHLNDNGFYGQSAKLQNVRIVAVQRPGWLQVFRFEANVRVRVEVPEDAPDPEPEYRDLYGLVRDDIRHNVNTVRVFEDEDQRRELFGRWSEDLICLRGAQGLQ